MPGPRRAAPSSAAGQSSARGRQKSRQELAPEMEMEVMSMEEDPGLTSLFTPMIDLDTRRPSALELHLARIRGAISDFETMYTESSGSRDSLLDDVSSRVDDMTGEAKYQMKSFIEKYKKMSAKLEESTEERDEILMSLADDLSDVKTSDEFETPISMMDTKFELDKLKRLNNEILRLSRSGEDTKQLQKEKERLQKDVIKNVVGLKEANEQNMRKIVQHDVAQALKFASGEIVDLLRSYREEGATMGSSSLEQRMQEILQMMETQAETVALMEIQLLEKSEMVNRYSDENQELLLKNMDLKAEKKKIKENLLTLTKRMQDYEPGGHHITVDLGKDEEDEDEEDKEESRRTHGASVGGGASALPPRSAISKGMTTEDPVILKAQLRERTNRVEILSQENQEFKEKLEELEQALLDKECEVDALEVDKANLMKQMKKANFRPDWESLWQCYKTCPERGIQDS
ncbi:intracellular protein transport protein USO1-like [Lingula anatina]|uniref:Intracellular protein transport protein USO1-like n=1 Tax=Lingula anatina TaxID=7574 RepID=A0A1S3ISS1_LINAN|nr:intracellular protein transport protein USO1-like [Lingula anatina]|eukprot:XP_013401260.1 intracellular protein transport protein USO1-like [Lingula anatina]